MHQSSLRVIAHSDVLVKTDSLLTGNKNSDYPVAFIQQEYLSIEPFCETQVCAGSNGLSLRRILFFDDLKEKAGVRERK